MEQELKQKQIEEMRGVIKHFAINQHCNKENIYKSHLITSDSKGIATALYDAGYRKIPENAVVILDEEMEEFAEKLAKSPQMQKVMNGLIKAWQKETAEKFAKLVEFHSVSTRDEEGREIFTISALGLKEILHEEFGIPYDEICKEITEGKV